MCIMLDDDGCDGNKNTNTGIETVLRIAILNRLIREDFSKTAQKQRSEENKGVSHVVI